MKPLVVVDPPATLARVFATRFGIEARAAIAARGRFSCALPGGSVAEEFLPVLAAAPMDWGKVDFFWGDERAVGPDDPDSNFGLAKRLLLDRVPAQAHRMPGEEADLEAAARVYAAQLAFVLGEPPRLDMVVLGVGPEGHVCSLFPGHPLLRVRDRLVAAITDSPKPPPRRLTFTLPALEQARLLVVAAFGAAKAEAIRAAVEDATSNLPVALALRAAPRALVLLDAAAAAQLEKPSS